MNNYPIYSIHNEFNNDGKEISQQEAEWAAYYTFKFPELNYFSSLGHPKGQKYFSEAIPDLYSPVTKEAFFMHGCIFHGHFDNCTLNPKATATSLNPFGKCFQEIVQESFFGTQPHSTSDSFQFLLFYMNKISDECF